MKHIAVAAHGIRTHGGWQKRLENLLQQAGPEIEVYHFSYGCFSFLAFLVPFLRWLIIRRFRRELRDLFARTSPPASTSWPTASAPTSWRGGCAGCPAARRYTP